MLQPTRRMHPPQSYPSNSRNAVSASRRFMNDTKPLNPEFLFRLVCVMSAPGPCVASLRGHMILTCPFVSSEHVHRREFRNIPSLQVPHGRRSFQELVLSHGGGGSLRRRSKSADGESLYQSIETDPRTSGSPLSLLPLCPSYAAMLFDSSPPRADTIVRTCY